MLLIQQKSFGALNSAMVLRYKIAES